MNKFKTKIIATVIFAMLSSNTYAVSTTEEYSFDYAQIKDFVRQDGNKFILEGQEFRISGTNNYYMHYGSKQMILSVLDDAQKLGINVIRVWGFMDGLHHNHTMQFKPGDYNVPDGNKSALEKLDFTVAEAKKRGIRLVIALTNNWEDFGGIPQYVKWFNAKEHDDFYTDKKIRLCYKNYVTHIIEHVNQYTNIKNSDEPTIMTWELANEPRAASDKSGKKLLKWADEMSTYIRKLAPKQLIALGSEGFFARKNNPDWTYNGNDGVDWDNIIRLPNISYGTLHLYPKTWSKDNAEQWGTQWIKEHARVAKEADKPVVLEEYGIGKDESINREFVYRKWTKTAYDEGLNGTMFWILTSKDPSNANGLYPDYDGFRVLNNQSELTDILKNHSKDMRNIKHINENESYIAFPKNNSKQKGEKILLKVYPFVNGDSAVKSITANVNGNNQIISFTEPDSDGYYTAYVDFNSGLVYGENNLTFNTEFTKGNNVKRDLKFELEKPVTGYKNIAEFNFSEGISDFSEGGTYQAEFLKPELEHAVLGDEKLLKLNVNLPGTNDWEEIRVHNQNVTDLSEAKLVSFDIYYPTDIQGGVRPYVVAGDGWVKLGVDKNNKNLSEMEIVNINNTPLYKQHISVDLGDLSGKNGDFYICIVGNKLKLKGSIFIDNLQFKKPVF